MRGGGEGRPEQRWPMFGLPLQPTLTGLLTTFLCLRLFSPNPFHRHEQTSNAFAQNGDIYFIHDTWAKPPAVGLVNMPAGRHFLLVPSFMRKTCFPGFLGHQIEGGLSPLSRAVARTPRRRTAG
jgi:hypothetical protein